MMKILFAGLGSIGQRHLQNLQQLLGKEPFQVDALRGTQRKLTAAIDSMIARQYTDIRQIKGSYDLIFIEKKGILGAFSLVSI